MVVMAVGEFDLSGKFIKIQKLANNLNILQMLAFKKFWDNYSPPQGEFPNDEELYKEFIKNI